MRIPFLRSYTAFSSHPREPHESLASSTDLEKNAGSNAVPTTTQASVPHQYLPPIDPSTLPARLVKLQNIVGISVPSAIRSEQPQRPAQNLGIYKRTVDQEIKLKFQYKLSTWAINACFLVQIIVGAALTSLGAAGGPSAAVTILGAVNTILAGLLTYLKGQGLPGRLEQHFQLLRTLREHIEERERDFAEDDCPLDVDEEIERIVRMYKEVRQTAQDNMPGNILPPRGSINSLMKKPDRLRREEASLTGRHEHSAPERILSGLQGMREKYEEHRHKAQTAVEKEKEVRDEEKQVSHGFLEEVEERKRRAGEQVEKVERHMRKAGEEVDRLETGLRNL